MTITRRAALFLLSLLIYPAVNAAKTMVLALSLVCCLNSIALYGQDFSKYEIYGAYSSMRVANPRDSAILEPEWNIIKFTISGEKDRHQYWKGLTTGITFNLNGYFGITGKFGWYQSGNSFFRSTFEKAPCYVDQCFPTQNIALRQAEASRKDFMLLAGPRFSMVLSRRFRPFAQALIGLNRRISQANRTYDIFLSGTDFFGPVTIRSETDIIAYRQIKDWFAWEAGIGLDLRLNDRVSLRLLEVAVLNSRETPRQYDALAKVAVTQVPGAYTFEASDSAFGSGNDELTNNVRISFGVVLHFGKT